MKKLLLFATLLATASALAMPRAPKQPKAGKESKTSSIAPKESKRGDTILIDERPRFPGGDFSRWLQEQAGHSMVRGAGVVVFEFIVEPDGRLTGFEVVESPDRRLSEEALRIVQQSPPWKPASRTVKIRSGAVLASNLAVPTRVRASIFFRNARSMDEVMDAITSGRADRIAPRVNEHNYTGSVVAFDKVSRRASFEGGTPDKFVEWLRQNVKLPKKQGGFKCGLLFNITPSGGLDGVQVLNSPNKAATEAIIEAMAVAPRWRPAISDMGELIAVSLMLIVDF